jgi:hypothetical protein
MCCGIKHIHHLPTRPDKIVLAYDGEEECPEYVCADRSGSYNFRADSNLLWQGRPAEEASERFIAYIEYLEKIRPYGLVEVSLNLGASGGVQAKGSALVQAEEGNIDGIDVYNHEYNGDVYSPDESGDDWCWTQEAWIPFLEELGFRQVSSFHNINSGNRVAVYHLTMDTEYYSNKGK